MITDKELDFVRKALEVDVRSIYQGGELVDYGRLGAAVAHQHVCKAGLVGEDAGVPDVLPRDQRLVVGVRDALDALLAACAGVEREANELFRQNGTPRYVVSGCLCDVVVLAKRAAQVAAIRPDRHQPSAGSPACQGLLLDRIEGDRGDATIRERSYLTFFPTTRATTSHLPRADSAGMGAGGAGDGFCADSSCHT